MNGPVGIMSLVISVALLVASVTCGFCAHHKASVGFMIAFASYTLGWIHSLFAQDGYNDEDAVPPAIGIMIAAAAFIALCAIVNFG